MLLLCNFLSTSFYGQTASGSIRWLFPARPLLIPRAEPMCGTLVLPTQNYPSGVYLVVVYNKNGVQAQKKLIIN